MRWVLLGLHMKASNYCFDLIKRFEGFSSAAYLCPAGKWTYGYGFTHNVKQGDYITKEQAEIRLKQEIKPIEDTLNSLVTVPLTQNQYDALCSFIFNLGARNFRNSTLLRKLNDGDYKGAANEFLRWTKAGGRELPGLVKRRKAERSLFLSND